MKAEVGHGDLGQDKERGDRSEKRNMTRDELIKYWVSSSDKGYKTMNHLFQSGDYSWALFVGHLVIEKLLKAIYVKNIDDNVPFIHDLVRIAEKGKLQLTEEQKDVLDAITLFNIKSRYPDYKQEFYKKCTKKFTEDQIKKIKEIRTWLKKKIKEKS